MVEFVISSSELSEEVLKSKIGAVLDSLSSDQTCSIAVVPRFLECAAVSVSSRENISICSLSLFAAQTYTEVAILEVAMALENGADQIEIPMNIGLINEENFAELQSRIEVIAEEIGDSAELSLLIDSNKLDSFDLLSKAIIVGIDAGATMIALNCKGSEEVKFLRESLEFVAKYNSNVKIKVAIQSSIESYKSDVKNFIAKCGAKETNLCISLDV